ncbi:hypothetical protein ACP4OV_022272 [Aristida adscensionis]
MALQQAERAAGLQDPAVRAELDRRAREDGETVVKAGAGGTSLDAQERLAEGRKKGGLSRAAESGGDRAESEGAVLVEPDEAKLKEAKEGLGRD